MKKVSALLAAALFTLVSCQQEREMASRSSNVIDFRADIGHYSVKATDTSFENGDEVSIAALSPINSGNVKYTVRNGRLSSENPICWLDGQSEKTEFILVYPYQKDLVTEGVFHLEFTVEADQSTHALYTASDLMLGDAYGVEPQSTVTFEVEHALSQVYVTIDNRSGKKIKDVFFSGVYGKAEMSSCGIQATGSLGTVKACPVTDGTALHYVLIIPPQTSKPELILTTTDGEQITYTLPSEVKFKVGTRSTADVVLSDDAVVTSFTTVISDWTPDNELNFSNGGQQSQDDDLQYLGTGKMLDGLFTSLFDLPRREFDADYYIDAEGNIIILDPYKNRPDLKEYGFEIVEGARITISYGKGGYYIASGSSTGVFDGNNEIQFSSYCEENWNGVDGSSIPYFQFDYEGCLSTQDKDMVIKYFDKYYVFSDINSIYTLPGHIRYPIQWEFPRMSYDLERGEVNLRTPMDLTRVGVAYVPFYQSVTNDLIDAITAGTAENMLYFNDALSSETDVTVVLPFTQTGAYRVIAAGDGTYANGSWYWGYRYVEVPFVASGDTAPECYAKIYSCEKDEFDATTVNVVVKGSDLLEVSLLPVLKSDYDATIHSPEDIANRLLQDKSSFIYSEIGAACASEAGMKISLKSLLPDTDYVLLMMARNLFDQTCTCEAEFSTGATLSFISMGKGKFYDGIVSDFLADTTASYFTEVEILQESTGKPLYRVMNPYAELLGTKPELLGAEYTGAASDYLEFFTHKYEAGNFVFFRPVYNGLAYRVDGFNHALSYVQNRGDVCDNPQDYMSTFCNRQVADGVFSIAPTVEIGESGYIFDCRDMLNAVVVVLPGYDWAPDAQVSTNASGASRRWSLKIPEKPHAPGQGVLKR